MKPLTIHFPGKLVVGNGCLEQLAEEIQSLGQSSVFLLTIEPLLSTLSNFISKLEKSGIAVFVETGITQEPSFSDFHRVMMRAAPFDPDIVLGIGGGSVLDVAKLVAAQLDNPQSLDEYIGNGLLSGRQKILICCPATSGTGSEVSPNAILVDDRDNQKKAVISPYLVADIVYVDALLTLSVPPAVTAATGLDALTHNLEAYTNLHSQPFIDIYALEGIRLIAANIVQAVRHGDDAHARAQVAMGSLLGGFCLGPVNTAAVHALSYPLGSQFHLPHGLSNALLLPYVMEYNIPSSPDRYAEVAVALGCERQKDVRVTAMAGVDRIRQLIKECGIPSRLRDLNIPKEAIGEMATAAMAITRLLNNNPRPVTYADAVSIFEAAY